jgi:hypothetical protein
MGADFKDQLLHMYVVERKRITKWYLKLLKRLLTSTVLNSVVVCRQVMGRNTEQLVEGLFMKYTCAEGKGVYQGGMCPITQFHS